MSDKPVSTDPGYVFRRFGLLMITLSMLLGASIVGAIVFRALVIESRLTFLLLGGITGVPFLAGLALAADWFRDLLIHLADRLPFVNFEKPKPPDA